MNQIRRLQYMSNQFFLNVPVELVRYFKLQKGDYLEFTPGGNTNLIIRKVAENTLSHAEAVLQNMKDEAHMLSMTINAVGSLWEPGVFSGRMAQLTNLQGRIRKLEKKLRI